MSREPPGVAAIGGAAGGEGEVEEAHALAGEVGAERFVEAALNDVAAGVEAQGVGLSGGGVYPGAPDGGVALEDDDAEALAAELARGDEAGGSGADDGHPADSWRRGSEGEDHGSEATGGDGVLGGSCVCLSPSRARTRSIWMDGRAFGSRINKMTL